MLRRPIPPLLAARPPWKAANPAGGWRRGFTLVEMLVAVALVMLLMALFAQVFQIAGGSVSTQRGLMENDQRARSVQTLLVGDLRKRTFRKVIPFTLNEQLDAPEADLSYRQGYFYISENDPNDDTDDVLALTVNALVKTETSEESPFYGKAVPLIDGQSNPNQPEYDDGQLKENHSADSPAAEVAYFLRNGNLYRRVLLIRKQADSVRELQPTDKNGVKFFARANPPGGSPPYPGSLGGTQFWNDFDFSAHPRVIPEPNTSTPSYFLYDGAEFSGVRDSLPLGPVPNMQQPEFRFPGELAYPPNRFGHNTINPVPLLSPPGFPFGGQPREYGGDFQTPPGSRWFVGRPTMEETSQHISVGGSNPRRPWDYPHLTHLVPNNVQDGNNPLNEAVLWADADGDSIIDYFAGGPRRGEDLVLSHVHAFDIKVWDEAVAQFVDLGHALADANNNPVGDFHLTRRLNPIYGPRKIADSQFGFHNRVFDTWYPFQTEDVNGDGMLSLNDDTNNNKVKDPGEGDADGDGVWDRSEDGSGGTAGALDHRQMLDFDGDGGILSLDTNNDGIADAGENFPPYRPLVARPVRGNANGNYVPFERWVPGDVSPNRYGMGSRVFPTAFTYSTQPGDPFYYICVNNDADGDGTPENHGSTEPLWPRTAGLNVTDGDLVWQAVDNRKRLRAIQITLRFLDPTTQQLRTLTIQHSLVD
jgi:prepilin-type N-terminal cleavage/methylation domain-containing protein